MKQIPQRLNGNRIKPKNILHKLSAHPVRPLQNICLRSKILYLIMSLTLSLGVSKCLLGFSFVAFIDAIVYVRKLKVL